MIRLGLIASVIAAAALGAPAAQAEIRIGVAAPMTGIYAWAGDRFQRGAELAVENLNAKGGVLGQRVELIVGDDFCDADQAVALARKLASDGVVFVAGHWCSHASIPASKVYEKAGILMMSPGSASAQLTDEGGPNVFRVYGRDDRQGAMVADYLAEHWGGKKIAILDDGTPWGAGVADGARRGLKERGVTLTLDQTIVPGEEEYSAVVAKMQAAGVEVLFLGGYHREAGLIFRHAHDRGYDLQLIANSAMTLEDFPMIAGPELEGTRNGRHDRYARTPRGGRCRGSISRAGLRAPGNDPLRLRRDSSLGPGGRGGGLAGPRCRNRHLARSSLQYRAGPIGFDAKGDVTGFEPWGWYVWQADGTYVPLEQGVAKQ